MSDEAKKDRTSDATHVGGEATVVPRWRVGRTLGRTIYYDDLLIGMVDTEAAAKRIVEAMNAPPQEPEVLFCDRCGRDHDEAGILSQVEVCRSCEASDAYEIDLCRSTIEELVLALRFTSPVEHPAMHEAWRRGKAFLDARRTNSATEVDDEHDLFCACPKCDAEHEEETRRSTSSEPPRETCDCGACAICQAMPRADELLAKLAADRSSDASPRCPHCRYCSLTCAQHAERSTDYDQASAVVEAARYWQSAYSGGGMSMLTEASVALDAAVRALPKRSDP